MFILTIILIYFTIYDTFALRSSSLLHYENGDENGDCSQLSHKSLIAILGQAFNPRYMSIEEPGNEREENTDAYGHKRSSNDLQFYVETDIISVGEFPAWETDHQSFYERKKPDEMRSRRQTHNVFERMTSSKSDLFKARPWECRSQINWIDLGFQYFPRYIRSVQCTTTKCWYGHFECKPKSFAIKVLRRKPQSCIRINDKLIMVTTENYNNDYAELWIWQEIPIDFCCECVMYF